MATKKKKAKGNAKANANANAKKSAKARKPAAAASKKSAPRGAAKKSAAKKPARKVAHATRKVAAKAKKAPKVTKAKAAKATKSTKSTKPVKASAARAKPLMRRQDRAGHLDPRYAAELRSRTDREPAEPKGFISRARSRDNLVEGLGEDFVGTATSGEYEGQDAQNEYVTEERGGPFVETTGGQEFARGTDASNPKGATREPFPRT